MSELLNFILDHEDAFKSKARLASLYSDFSYQAKTNPDGYIANVSAWRQAIARALRAGKVPSSPASSGGGGGNDTLVLETGEELSRALDTRTWGRPVALGSVIQEGIEKRQLIPLHEFMNAKTSIYSRSWLPSPWQVVSWGLRQLGLVNKDSGDKLRVGKFVVTDNLESAAQSILSQISKANTSPTSNIHSLTTFTHAYSHLFKSTNAPLSPRDSQILLTYLSRDKPSLSWNPSTRTINLSSTQPITQNDISIAQLKTLLLTLSTAIPALEDRQSALEKKAREAVAAKQTSSAKAALRSKKIVEETLDRRRANALQLEEILTKIDEAHDQVAIVRVMESSAAVLKNLNKEIGGVERVEKVTANLRDQVDQVEDVNQVINEVGAEGATVDEAEVDEEFEALERAERERVEQAEAEARRVEEERRAEETRRRLAELEELEKKRKEIETKAQAQKSPEAGQEEKQEPEVQQPEQPEQITLPERPAPSEDSKTKEEAREKEAPIAAS